MPKSHDQPLCAYWMRYDADIQSHPRSWPKWNDIYTKYHWNPMKTVQVIIRTTNTRARTQVHEEKCKKFRKYTNIDIQQNLRLILHVSLRSLNIPCLKALAEKLTSGMPKMCKSHDRPLCTYLVRYETHIQPSPRSWPKWYIHKKIEI